MIEKLFKAKKIDYTILIKTINHIAQQYDLQNANEKLKRCLSNT